MIQYKCDKCGRKYSSDVFFCSTCKGEEFTEIEIEDATVVMSLLLNATAEPYPDTYYVNLVEKDGTKIFCRSEGLLEKGKSVRVESDENGITCH